MATEEGEGEDSEEEGPVLPGLDSGWVPVATNVDGQVEWAAGYEDIERCRDALSLLQEINEHHPDWTALLRGLKQLAVLEECDVPLHTLGDFDQIEGFLTIDYSNLWGYSEYLFISAEMSALDRRSLFGEFAELARRLKSYEPLRDYWRYM